MKKDETNDLLSALRDLLRPHLERSEPLRRVAHHVGQWLIEESWRAQAARRESAAEPQPPSSASQAPGEKLAEVDQPAPSPDQGLTQISETLPLKLGDESVEVRVTGTPQGLERARVAAEATSGAKEAGELIEPIDEQDVDLLTVEQRCRLKVASCRLFIERRAAMGDSSTEPALVDEMNEMIAQAKRLPDCFLWVFWRERVQPTDEALRMIAKSYDALAHTTALVRFIEEMGDHAKEEDLQESFELLAEADSALRIALEQTWLTSPDVDQDEVHQWIRRETSRRQIYVSRFMKLDDPADPGRAEDVIRRATTLLEDIQARRSRQKQIKQTFNKLKYHAGMLDNGQDDSDGHNYRKMSEAITTLIELGVPISDRGFRRIIDTPTIASFPPQYAGSPGVSRVLAEVQEWHNALAAMENAIPDEDKPRWSDRVREVRTLLADGEVVIIGGEPRPEAAERIKSAFDLAEVVWVRLTEHGTGQPMRAPIARPEARLVLVLTKLAGHLHTEEASGYAKDARKPCVFLKAGYNPEQIAEAVLQQASEQLRQQISLS